MPITVSEGQDQATACLRTYRKQVTPEFIETIMGPVELADHIAQCGEQLARMHRSIREVRRATPG